MAAVRSWFDIITVFSLCAMIFMLPFSKSAVEIFSLIAIASYFICKALSYRPAGSLIKLFRPIPTELNLPIYLFALTNLVSTFYTVSIALSLKGYFFKILQGLILFFIIAEYISSRKKLDLILGVIFASMALIAVDGICQRITGWDFIRHYRVTGWDIKSTSFFVGRRVSASFINPNGFGGWLTIMIPLSISAAFSNDGLTSKRAVKSLIWLLAGLLILCLLLTVSKGAWLGFIFSMIFFFIINKKKLLMAVFAFTIIAMVTFSHANFMNLHKNTAAYPDRAAITAPSGNGSSVGIGYLMSVKKELIAMMLERDSVRTNLWRQASQIVKDFPFFGCGLNTYSIVAPRYRNAERESGIYPHNSYLQMAAETGLVGLATFLSIIITLFKISLESMKKIKSNFYSNILLGLLAGLFGFLVHSFFDVNFYALQLANLMWFVIGLIIAVQRIALAEHV